MIGAGLLSALLGVSGAVAAEVEADGFVGVDLRYRVSDVPAGPWYAPTGVSKGAERMEGVIGGNFAVFTDRWGAHLSGRLVSSAAPESRILTELTRRSNVDVVDVELDEATIEGWNVFLEGLDIKAGHQVVQWGVGDQFNPTNTLNPEDLEDPTRFGAQLPNTMIRADFSMTPTWTLSGVFVPVFRPAVLPSSAAIGLAAVDRIPVVEDEVRRDLLAKMALGQDLGFPTILNSARLDLPPPSLQNTSGMIRLGGAIGMTDVALSWYSGRTDMPVATANHTALIRNPVCHPDQQDQCIQGYMLTDATLAYPRMHVAGLNLAGEVMTIGWRFEGAMVIPERTTIEITNDELDFGSLTQAAGELEYGLGGERPDTVTDEAYAKWTLGIDYTLGPLVYVNAQWVHGMVDEFGAGDFLSPAFVTRAAGSDWEIRRLRQGDYAVVGVDLNLRRATARLFAISDVTGYRLETRHKDGRVSTEHFSALSKRGASGVLYPELMFDLGDGLDLSVGALILLGQEHTKFGDPAAGGDIVFTRANAAF